MSPIVKPLSLACGLAVLAGCNGALSSGALPVDGLAAQGSPSSGAGALSHPSPSPSGTTGGSVVITSYGANAFTISLDPSGAAHYARSSASNAALTLSASVSASLAGQLFQDLSVPIPTQAPGTIECQAVKRDYMTAVSGSQHFSSQICGPYYWPKALDSDVSAVAAALGLSAAASPSPGASPSPSASPSPVPSPSAS